MEVVVLRLAVLFVIYSHQYLPVTLVLITELLLNILSGFSHIFEFSQSFTQDLLPKLLKLVLQRCLLHLQVSDLNLFDLCLNRKLYRLKVIFALYLVA